MSAVTKHEIVSLIEGLIESDACMGSISDKQVVMALEVVSRIKANGIAPSDNVKQADEETHRRVDEAVRNGRIEDRRAGGEAVSLSREEIIRMAREAGLFNDDQSPLPEFLEHFANAAYAAGAAAERDACAKVCDRFQERDVGMKPAECAAAIRARGDK